MIRVAYTEEWPGEAPVLAEKKDGHWLVTIWAGLPAKVRGEAVRVALRAAKEGRREFVLVPAALGAASAVRAASRHPVRAVAASGGSAAAAGALAAGLAFAPHVPPAVAAGPVPPAVPRSTAPRSGSLPAPAPSRNRGGGSAYPAAGGGIRRGRR